MAASDNEHPKRASTRGQDSGTGAVAPVTGVLRTADVLSYLAQTPGRPAGVTEIATELGLSKAVVFRILVSLQNRGYVESDAASRRYLL